MRWNWCSSIGTTLNDKVWFLVNNNICDLSVWQLLVVNYNSYTFLILLIWRCWLKQSVIWNLQSDNHDLNYPWGSSFHYGLLRTKSDSAPVKIKANHFARKGHIRIQILLCTHMGSWNFNIKWFWRFWFLRFPLF